MDAHLPNIRGNGRGHGVFNRGGYLGRGNGRRGDIIITKLNSNCAACGRRGHWASDHLANGTIRDNFQSMEPHSTTENKPSN